MYQNELIEIFPSGNSIADRLLLVGPDEFELLKDKSVSNCRVFVLVTQGILTAKVGTSVIKISANSLADMLVWDPIHFLSFSNDLIAWCILPNYKFANESLNGLKHPDSDQFKAPHSFPLLMLEQSETKILEQQICLLYNALKSESHAFRTELCQAYFKCFLLESSNILHNKRLSQVAKLCLEKRQDIILRNFLRLVWKYYKMEHNLPFYAAKLCISSQHLSKVVRSILGKTPFAVIHDELIQRASYLLRETQNPVQEIAAELNFSETSAFCKFFKKHTGLSPTAFRKARF